MHTWKIKAVAKKKGFLLAWQTLKSPVGNGKGGKSGKRKTCRVSYTFSK